MWFVGVCRRRMSQSAVDEEFDGQPTQARRAMQTIISNPLRERLQWLHEYLSAIYKLLAR
jgi:hypothetical protein